MAKICGVGVYDMRGKWCSYKEYTPYNEYQYRVYTTWKSMLDRSYRRGLGSTVCDRWKVFSNFVKDIRYIPGYKLFVQNLGTRRIFLDKDTKYFGNRTYDPSTVRFITCNESGKDVVSRRGMPKGDNKKYKGRAVVAINISDPLDIRIYPSTRDTEKDGFNHSSVSSCCRGKQKYHRGYYWKWK